MMNHHFKFRRFVSVFLAALLSMTLFVPAAVQVNAANRRFITELRVAAGAQAVDALEADGWSVMMVGLNVTSDPATQVYLAYKMNTGSPVTNVILSPDVGDSFTDANGIVYTCVSHVDVDEGIEGSAGCLYATHDERAGTPLVGLDVLRGSTEDDKVLYTVSNDGAQIVRTREGKPADLENANAKGVVYLFQIRDGIVRPYISEIGIVTDTDKWNAVYTACERGYNYFVEGDIDDSPDTYTIIAFERTADPQDAVTGITAVSAETVKSLEDAQIVDGKAENAGRVTAAAISISGVEYVRVSSQPIGAKEPYYLYRTKDAKAGNPVSMLYAETPEQTQNFLFGTWANSYFFSPGATTAYSYCMNEDLYLSLWEDQTVCCKLPVRLIDSFTSMDFASEAEAESTTEAPTAVTTEVPTTEAPTTEAPTTEAPTMEAPATEESIVDAFGMEAMAAEAPATEAPATEPPATEAPATEAPATEAPATEEPATEKPATETPATEAPATEAPAGTGRYINLTMLTPRDGLPASAGRITGMRSDLSAPYMERTERSNRNNKYQASVFGKGGIYALITGGVLILAAAAAIIIRKSSAKKITKSAKPKGRR